MLKFSGYSCLIGGPKEGEIHHLCYKQSRFVLCILDIYCTGRRVRLFRSPEGDAKERTRWLVSFENVFHLDHVQLMHKHYSNDRQQKELKSREEGMRFWWG